MLETIEEKIQRGQRVTRKEAEFLWAEAPNEVLSRLATVVRGRFHNPKEATYLIMSIINYTNVCVAKCDYCAFFRLPHQTGTYLLEYPAIREKILALRAQGGTMVGFNGGFHPKLRISDYAQIFSKVRAEFGQEIEFYGMTVAEFMFASKVSRLSYAESAQILRANGSRWITGGGAEILDEDFRKKHSPGKFSVEDYFFAQAELLKAGLGSTATMVVGFDETISQRFNHLERLRQFQDEVPHKLASFLCWTYKPYHTEFGGSELTTEEYLRWMAICRIYLDNFRHFRTSVLTKNDDALLALNFGANDFDLPTEDEVTQKAGATISLDFGNILKRCENLGYQPILRKPLELRDDGSV